MSTSLLNPEPLVPDEKDVPLAKESSRQLSRFASQSLKITLPDTGETVTLPAGAVRLLIDLLSQMARGNPVTIVPFHAELTTQEAADFLGASRPFLVKKLEDGSIPFRKVGTHRRIQFQDLLNYKRGTSSRRLKALEELTAEAQDMGLGY